MEFENYAKRINSLKDIESFGQFYKEKQTQFRLSVKNNSVVLEEVQKSNFAQINDEKYYFINGKV